MSKSKIKYYTDTELDILRSRIRSTRDKAIVELILEKGWLVADIVKIRLSDINFDEESNGLMISFDGKMELVIDSIRRLFVWLEDHPKRTSSQESDESVFVDQWNPPFEQVDARQTCKRINRAGTDELTTKRKPRFETVYKGLLDTHQYYSKHPRETTTCPKCGTRANPHDVFCDLCKAPIDPDWRKIYQRRLDGMKARANEYVEIRPIFTFWSGLWGHSMVLVGIIEKFADVLVQALDEKTIKIDFQEEHIAKAHALIQLIKYVKEVDKLAPTMKKYIVNTSKEVDSQIIDGIKDDIQAVVTADPKKRKKILKEVLAAMGELMKKDRTGQVPDE